MEKAEKWEKMSKDEKNAAFLAWDIIDDCNNYIDFLEKISEEKEKIEKTKEGAKDLLRQIGEFTAILKSVYGVENE